MPTSVVGVRAECARCAICEPLRRRNVNSIASCAAFHKRYPMMRLNRPPAAAAARGLHARARHARARKLARAWSVR
eukprot:6808255-Lingulodinium_polyedra.AAC.1